MTVIALHASIVLLFLLCSASVYHLLLVWLGPDKRRVRPLRLRFKHMLHQAERSVKPYRHLSEILQSAQVKLSAIGFAYMSLLSGTAGAAAGSLYFQTLKGACVLGGMMLVLPYLWLRSRLISRQIKHRIEFLPAVETFYQTYILAERKNIRAALKAAVQSGRLPSGMQAIFEQLYAGLMVQRETEQCLRIFAYALGSRWADHFAAMLRFALEDGADLTIGMRELITDMRRAMRSDHAERNRLLEIRIANFSPLVFLAAFIAVNYKIDPEQTYRYYMVSAEGKDMLLDALVLIGASFVMGLYLSMRKI